MSKEKIKRLAIRNDIKNRLMTDIEDYMYFHVPTLSKEPFVCYSRENKDFYFSPMDDDTEDYAFRLSLMTILKDSFVNEHGYEDCFKNEIIGLLEEGIEYIKSLPNK